MYQIPLAGLQTRHPSPKARSVGFSELSNRCCKIKTGAVLGAVGEILETIMQ
jgi:hypothetical protein